MKNKDKIELAKVILWLYIKKDKERTRIWEVFYTLLKEMWSEDTYIYMDRIGISEEELVKFKPLLGDSMYQDLEYYIFEVYHSPSQENENEYNVETIINWEKKKYLFRRDDTEAFFHYLKDVYDVE